MEAASRHPVVRPGLGARLAGFVRWTFLFAVAIAALLVIGGTLAYRQLDEEIREHVEQQLRLHYGPRGLEVRIGSARRVEGKGIELREVRFLQAGRTGANAEMAYVGEGFIACSTDLQDLLAGKLAVKQVTLRRLKLRAQREPDGTWNVQRLYPPPKMGSSSPGPTSFSTRLAIEQASIEIVDRVGEGTRTFALREINVELSPLAQDQLPGAQPEPPVLSVKGTFAGDHFERINLEGLYCPAKGFWSAQGAAEGVQISPALRAALPREAADAMAPLAALRGQLRLDYRLMHSFKDAQPLQFVVSGELSDGQISDSRLPYPLTEIRADVYCDNRGLKVDRMTAKSGLGQIELTCQRNGFAADSPLVLRAKARNLELDARLAGALPPEVRTEWNKLQPAGTVHVDLSLVFDGRRWRPNLMVDCLDVSLAHYKFPYRLSGAKGAIVLKDDVLTIRLRALAARQVVRIDGDLQNLGVDYTGTLVATMEEPIPIDEALLSAIGPKSQKTIRALHPQGSITGQARFERRRQDQQMTQQFRADLSLHDCAMKYEKFPYAFERMRGRMIITDSQCEIRDFEGYNGSAYVTCQGSWTTGPRGSLLKLDIVGTDVALEDQLRLALNPSAQRMWAQARPRGTIDHLRVGINYSSANRQTAIEIQGQKWKKQQNLEGRSITLEPAWFPYRLDNVTGLVQYKNGEVILKNVSATHGPTSISLAGKTEISRDGRWRLFLDRVTANRVRIDHDLLAALPVGQRGNASRLNLTGPLSMQGALEVKGDGRENSQPQASWDATFDVEAGGVDCGVKLEHMHGGVRLVGGYDGKQVRTRGELQFDSLVCKGVQLTNLSGPLWIDGSQILFGSRADAPRDGELPRQITAQVYGGTVGADAQVTLRGETEFDAQVTLADADLATLSREFKKGTKPLQGKAYASLHLTGNSSGTHTLHGGGNVRLRDADIYEVPVMLALLKLVSIRRPNTTAFNNSDIDFRIQGDRLYFDKVDFKGDAITLKGKGEMDFDKHLNLEFYALVGRGDLRVPIITPMLGLASQQLLLIQIAGTIDHPELNKKAFPALNDSLKQLFPETQEATTWNGPTLVSPAEALKRSGLMRR